MFGFWKIFVLLAVWVLTGAAIYCAICFYYSIKVSLLDCDDSDGIMAEFINLLTHNVMGIKKTDKPKDVYRMASELMGEPVWKGLLRMWFVWPDTMAKVQPHMKEAYEILRDKYGLRMKNSAT